jgi:hypothetical protein
MPKVATGNVMVKIELAIRILGKAGAISRLHASAMFSLARLLV